MFGDKCDIKLKYGGKIFCNLYIFFIMEVSYGYMLWIGGVYFLVFLYLGEYWSDFEDCR